MSISRNSAGNDDFMIAIGGVYQKKVKRSLAKQSAAAAQSQIHLERDNHGSSNSKRNTMSKNIVNGTEFFMPNLIKSKKE